jgi:hypothetical protein
MDKEKVKSRRMEMNDLIKVGQGKTVEGIWFSAKVVGWCFILGLLVLLFGCKTLPSEPDPSDPMAHVPLKNTFWSIYREKAVEGKNDCSNTCSKYVRHLLENDHKAVMVYMHTPDPETEHIVAQVKVKVKGKEKFLYCDVVNGKVSWESDKFGEPWFTIPYEDRAEWGNEFVETPDAHGGKGHGLVLGTDGLSCTYKHCVVNGLEGNPPYIKFSSIEE